MSDPNIHQIPRAMAAGRIRITEHARTRMAQRGVVFSDLRKCGETGICTFDPGRQNYRVTGVDTDGEKLEVIADFDGDAVVITVMG